jgi:hypothetical protein
MKVSRRLIVNIVTAVISVTADTGSHDQAPARKALICENLGANAKQAPCP